MKSQRAVISCGSKLIVVFLILFISLKTFGQDVELKKTSKFKQTITAFSPGEMLKYEVSWMGIIAGKSQMVVGESEKLRDVDVWPLRSSAETSGLVKKLYKIDNKTVSFLDPTFCYPVRFEVDQYTGGRKEKIELNFFQKKRLIEWSRSYKGKQSSGTSDITRGVQDSLSSIYYLRNQDLQVGHEIKIPIFASRKKWMLQADIVQTEKIVVPAGTFQTLKVKPIMLPESEGKPKGTMTLWLTNDARHIPVQISSEVAVGSVIMKMVSMKIKSEKSKNGDDE
ncbi:DUF3108 domain-containing protein [candidate division CSSED10-310 bacterium]|uniref:DUF3108 domain-containing protein n=1 Tax=candidate division CSSED10-310 bacterium TaxID=2855610 RepID=A0ABV6Z351_UNCC1